MQLKHRSELEALARKLFGSAWFHGTCTTLEVKTGVLKRWLHDGVPPHILDRLQVILDQRMGTWESRKGRQVPWIASGNAVYEARQVILYGVPVIRQDGKPSMEADRTILIGTCEDFGEAANIANHHNASIGHWMFDDFLAGRKEEAHAG